LTPFFFFPPPFPPVLLLFFFFVVFFFFCCYITYLVPCFFFALFFFFLVPHFSLPVADLALLFSCLLLEAGFARSSPPLFVSPDSSLGPPLLTFTLYARCLFRLLQQVFSHLLTPSDPSPPSEPTSPPEREWRFLFRVLPPPVPPPFRFRSVVPFLRKVLEDLTVCLLPLDFPPPLCCVCLSFSFFFGNLRSLSWPPRPSRFLSVTCESLVP